MEKIDPAWITENFISLIGREWMLVTAGDASRFNTMTASWGGVGYLWNKPVVFVRNGIRSNLSNAATVLRCRSCARSTGKRIKFAVPVPGAIPIK